MALKNNSLKYSKTVLILVFLISLNFSFTKNVNAEEDCTGNVFGKITCYIRKLTSQNKKEIIDRNNELGNLVRPSEDLPFRNFTPPSFSEPNTLQRLMELLEPKSTNTTADVRQADGKGTYKPLTAILNIPVPVPLQANEEKQIPSTENLFDPGDERQKQMLSTVLNLTSAEVSNPVKLERAVRGFQDLNNLPSTGKIDKETANKIEDTYGGVLQKQGEITREIQSEQKGARGTTGVCTGEPGTNKEIKEMLIAAQIKHQAASGYRGLPKDTVLMLEELERDCSCKVTITSATRANPVKGTPPAGNHGIGKRVVDLAPDGKLSSYIYKNGKQFKPCWYEAKGIVFFDEIECSSKNKTAAHWHVEGHKWRCGK